MLQNKAGDPRVRRTRNLIVQAFNELMMEKSFNAMSVQDISERAEINRGTFYAHFEDKYALLEYCMRERFLALLAQQLPDNGHLSKSHMHILITTVFQCCGEINDNGCQNHDRHMEPLFEKTLQHETATVLMRWLHEAIPYEKKYSVSIETTATVISCAICGAALQWSQGAREQSINEMTLQIMQILNTGLAQIVPMD